MSIPNFIRAYEAEAAVDPYLIAAFSDVAASSKISPAAASTDPLAGTTGKLGGEAGDMVDLTKGGIGSVTLGGTVTAGAALTSDANAAAVATTTAGDRIIGYAEQPGVAGDIIDYFCAPGVIGEEAA